MREFKIKNLNNTQINILEGSNIEKPTAILINVHGITSHFQEVYYMEDSFRYRNNFFYNNDIKLFGLEFHGHGKSDGVRCSINDFDDLVDDLYCLIKYINVNYDEKIPKFIIAESMGGAVAIKYNIKYQFETNIRGYILLAPMCGIDENLKPHPFTISLLMFLSNYFPELPVLSTNSKMKKSCKNKKFLELKDKNKFYYHGKLRLNTARECYYTSLWINKYGHLFNAPLFLIHGKDDDITNPYLSIKFFNSVPNKSKKIFLPKNTNHALALPIGDNDVKPKIIWIKILLWIKSQLDIQ
tara:strand:- start:4008 stop:4901 length:894 start_codon:yes stop_codon:yes gene_type:complete